MVVMGLLMAVRPTDTPVATSFPRLDSLKEKVMSLKGPTSLNMGMRKREDIMLLPLELIKIS